MATVTKSIGSGKDYSTVVAWEAASYGATGADDAIGEVYGATTEPANVVINDATPISIKLIAASGEEHDGTAGSGARLLFSGGNYFTVSINEFAELSWIEIDLGSGASPATASFNFAGTVTVNNNIFHNILDTGGTNYGLYFVSAGLDVIAHNNLIYNLTNSAVIIGITLIGSGELLNNTVTGIESTASYARGIYALDNANVTLKNNLVSDIIGFTTTECYDITNYTTATTDSNGADDATASGTNPYDNMTVTFTGGGDYTPTADSDVLSGGADLATTPSGVEIDLKGRNRDSEGDTWSLGAIQHVIAAGGESGLISGKLINGTLLRGLL